VRSILAATGEALADLEALLLPVACLGCGTWLPPESESEACCAVCRTRMRALAPPACPRCGQPIDSWEASFARRQGEPSGSDARRAAPPACGFCAGWPPELAWAASAVWMEDGPARELVHALKYDGWRSAASPMAEIMARATRTRLAGTGVLVPVPLGRRRERERGHNQAAVLASALGPLVGLPVAAGGLRRVRETRSQTVLGPSGRWTNVAGAFAAGEGVSGTRVALVDDVLTTGATLAACAAALAAGGAGVIGAVTFARAAVPH
jgi:ComF family protein